MAHMAQFDGWLPPLEEGGRSFSEIIIKSHNYLQYFSFIELIWSFSYNFFGHNFWTNWQILIIFDFIEFYWMSTNFVRKQNIEDGVSSLEISEIN